MVSYIMIEVFRTMSALQELRSLLRLRALQLLALLSLLILMAAIAFAARTTVRDPDIWWHLKVGDWIVQHHAVPYVGIFSALPEHAPGWPTVGAMRCCCRALMPGSGWLDLPCSEFC